MSNFDDYSLMAVSLPSGRALPDLIYPIPDPMRSYEEWQVWRHADLSDMTPAEKRFDLTRLIARLHVDPSPHHWLLERLAVLRDEVDRGR